MAFRGSFGTCAESPQRSFRDMCGIYLRGGLTELIRRTPRKIKFLSPQLGSNPRPSWNQRITPRSGAFRRLARLPGKSARYIVKERLPLGHTTKSSGVSRFIHDTPLLGYISLTGFRISNPKNKVLSGLPPGREYYIQYIFNTIISN